MKLFADSGSTKTSWLLKAEGNILQEFETKGMNPFFISEDEIINELETHLRPDVIPHITVIHFFGAGCSSPEKVEWLESIFSNLLQNATINIYTDIDGATKATVSANEKSIVSILGTGSTFRIFDGENVFKKYSSLGYIIGDEGSGTHISKALLRKVFYKQFPANLEMAFLEYYNTTRESLIENVYSNPLPNRYLAKFTTFCSQNIHLPEIQQIILESFDSFITNHITNIPNYKDYKLHFVGSVAFHFREQLEKTVSKYECSMGKIVQKPIYNLVQKF